jgi:phosphoribosylaminoimidazole-succinocarboxamide synthase
MTDSIVASISARYKELYQQMTGSDLTPVDYSNILPRIEQNVMKSVNSVNLEKLKK